MAEQQVQISNLPLEIQQEIPISLRLNADLIDIKDLPIEVQYRLNNYLLLSEVSSYRPVVIYDATFKYSIYNDVQLLETKKSTIVEYIKNYLTTNRGSYPFDPSYGNLLKQQLQTKDTELRKMLVSNELTNLMTLINNTFSTQIKIISSKITKIDQSDHSEYKLELELSIDNSAVKLTLQ